ncbi:MAG TPA: hypothetical protein VH062_04950 [Polyangiaceae bacterium]|jgi:hypothetical protein|nr:hypothetical protein [Polyangiaceae bacterium]
MSKLDHDARRILELTRQARTPTDADKARVERLLAGALVLGSTTAHAAGGSATSKMVGTAFATKWLAVIALAVSGAAAYAGWHAWGASRATAAHATVTAATPAPTAVTAATPANDAPVDGVTSAPTAVTSATAANDVPDVVESPTRAVVTAARAGVRATLPEELDLLHAAQAKWRAGNAGAALALLGEHRQRYPRSELAPERDALTVLSLCATGRAAEAHKIAARFLRNARHSPLRASVEESCGGK